MFYQGWGGGVLKLMFDGMCSTRSKILPTFKDFSTPKKGQILLFAFVIFGNWDPLLRVFNLNKMSV